MPARAVWERASPSLPRPCSNRPLSRRRLLELGGISMLGLGLADLLKAASRAAVASSPERSSDGARREKSCIFIVQYGGASQLDTWDPKPSAPDDIRGPYRPIETSVPGVFVGELLPRLARLAHRYALVRSMTHKTADHDGGMHVAMTGSSSPVEGTPYFGSLMAKLRPATTCVPSYVWLQNLDRDVQPRYLTGGFLGAAHAPLRIGVNEDNASAPQFRVTDFDPPPEVTASRVRERYQLLTALEPLASSMVQPGSSMRTFQERAIELVTGPEARRAFDLNDEPTATRDHYGRHPLGQNLLMSRRLIEAGVRLVSVNAWLGVAPGEKFLVTQGWDMHGAAVQGCGIFSTGTFGLGFALPRFDQAVAALLEDLDARGLLETTLVVAVGEFGRTPRIASNPYAGRDHWPACYSAMLAGAGIRGGAVYGASDASGAFVRHHPVTPEDFGATLLEALGVDPETRLGADGFTRPASQGRPVFEIFG